jgi:glycosyltransferase involved in cell wall biosynthesis
VRILLVSWYFPPANASGAVRVGKLAKFLTERKHDVHVLAGRNRDLPHTLPLEVARDRVHFADCIDVNRPLYFLQDLYRSAFGHEGEQPLRSAASVEKKSETGRSVLQRLSDLYVHLIKYPDRHVGWIPAASMAARRLTVSWQPDLVYASGPPFTTLLLGHRIARRLRVPWIAEFRDRWVDDPYNEYPDWQRRRLSSLERRVVSTAAGIVTVSEPWAEMYRTKFGKPVSAIYNGFDPADFPIDRPGSPRAPSDELDIVYTGVIYAGRRDPSPLFQAIGLLGNDRGRVSVSFYGSEPELVLPVAERCGVTDRVRVHPAVPYRESIEIQRSADVLLLMQWNDPKEQGNCPAKLFEYLAVLRPILGLGLENGVPATIIRDRQAGFFSNDPQEIAAQLKGWLTRKQRHGNVPFLPVAARQGMSRDTQFQALEEFIQWILSASGNVSLSISLPPS